MHAVLGAIGGEPPDEAVVWRYARADRRAVASGGIAEVVGVGTIQTNSGGRGV